MLRCFGPLVDDRIRFSSYTPLFQTEDSVCAKAMCELIEVTRASAALYVNLAARNNVRQIAGTLCIISSVPISSNQPRLVLCISMSFVYFTIPFYAHILTACVSIEK